MSQQVDDPFDSASNAELPPNDVWGCVAVDAWFCVLLKVAGAVAFDPQQHKIEDRRTQIEMSVLPLAEMNLQFNAQRKMLAESREWAGIVWPSLKDLGIKQVREINNKWARVEMVSTGRTYEKEGVKKTASTFKFLAIFDTEDACRAAYLAEHPEKAVSALQPARQPDVTTTAPPAGMSPTEREKATALKFVEALIPQVAGDETKLAERIAALAPIAKHFTVQSPEVRVLIDTYNLKQMGAQPF